MMVNILNLQALTVDLTKCKYIEFNGNKFKVSKRYIRYCPFINRCFESDEVIESAYENGKIKISECERILNETK